MGHSSLESQVELTEKPLQKPSRAQFSFAETMPGANKYSVATTNRFMLDSAGDSSGSEDEGINQDPFAMIKQAEIDAVKNAKQAQKDKAAAEKAQKAAAAKAAKAAITGEKSEEKKGDDRRNNRPRREPRGNQQPRRGKRFENNDENKDGENNENQGQLNERNNRPPRTNDRRRGNDRKSGDPRTGYRSGAQGEKRGGRGKGNWGDKTENPDETAEKPTPEAVTDDNAENKAPAKEVEEAENAEPEEPAEVQLTLEEYMATLAAPSNDAPKTTRKANDGDNILKGQVIKSQKIHKERTRKFGGQEKESNKLVIDSKDLGFQSGANRRGGSNFYYDGDNNNRRDNRGGNRRGGNRQGGNRGGDNRGQQQKGFNMESFNNDEAFPTLGGKK